MSLESPTFQATLAQPLNFGHILEICGKAQQNANSISIKFSRSKSACTSSNDLILQILMDFRKKQIILTQFSYTDSNSVVSKELMINEFLNDFKFYIMMAETKFFIALNNKAYVSVQYIQNLTELQIQEVEISGKFKYVKQLDHHKYFPHTWPPIQVIEDNLDFSNDQPMSFKTGHVMTISACLQGSSKGRFVIQFRHSRDNKRQELHLSVRFDSKKVIRNSKCRQADDKLIFGQELIDDAVPFPFADFSKPFKLAVAFCETEFRLAKDGQYMCNFTYRSPNILPFVMGPKIFGVNGVNVRVWGIEHLPLEDAQCKGFETYSSL